MSQTENPKVLIETSLGEIKLELFPLQAPLTVANFLAYIARQAYQNSSFYRVVRPDNLADNPVPNAIPIRVIQGGLGMEPHALKHEAIKLERTSETGLNHRDGSISMGRFTPDSAESEFFICLGEQPELDYGGKRNPDGQGFAAFGQVIEGRDIVEKIYQSPAEGQWFKPAIAIHSIKRLD